jgi:hypothetical protein
MSSETPEMICQNALLHILEYVSVDIRFSYNDKKFYEEFIACYTFTLHYSILHAPHRKHLAKSSLILLTCVSVAA